MQSLIINLSFCKCNCNLAQCSENTQLHLPLDYADKDTYNLMCLISKKLAEQDPNRFEKGELVRRSIQEYLSEIVSKPSQLQL